MDSWIRIFIANTDPEERKSAQKEEKLSLKPEKKL
jgi:hypothetical protein